ncbi:hypothetical protein [Devosia ginsengisoli]|uniref:hypothetical protein n=1 Tax=Devosia ginsengisoli TaxID=400770 RepID=UPI0026ED37C7|nr:hypothetical protein [Devosia ginsengisoli]MCR6671472.1 hypothetical protein [Devosia ginsengisoli]
MADGTQRIDRGINPLLMWKIDPARQGGFKQTNAHALKRPNISHRIVHPSSLSDLNPLRPLSSIGSAFCDWKQVCLPDQIIRRFGHQRFTPEIT